MDPHELRRYLSDTPGHPLGKGMPMGKPLRQEFLSWHTQSWRGETRLQAWERIVRCDPCSFCGERGGTVDHVEPRTLPVRGLGGAHSWLNVTSACERCNNRKARKSLLTFMLQRRYTWR